MIVKINICKGKEIKEYAIIEIDYYQINNNHLALFKNNIQIAHYPARYFSVEVVS
jgi:hypothetical protein